MEYTHFMELAKVVDQVANLDPGARALFFEGRWYSWGELNAIGDRILALVDEAGIPPLESIGLVLRNDPLFVAAIVAAFRAGRPVLTFSPLLPDAALADDIRANRPAALVALPDDIARPGFVDRLSETGALGVLGGDAPSVVP